MPNTRVSNYENSSSSNSSKTNEDQDNTKTVNLDILNGDGTGSGPGTLLGNGNSSDPNSVYVIDPKTAPKVSPKKSPVKNSQRGRSDKPPQNARLPSPRKSKTYLDFDGPDSDDELDGALLQVYGKVEPFSSW